MIPGSMRETAGNFINHIISNLIFPLENQEHIMVNGNVDWCLDWWAIEIAKYFFEGEEAYMRYPIARRLGSSKNFDKKHIMLSCRSRDAFMEEMKVTSQKKLLVKETCRGFDTRLALTTKEWDTIIVLIMSEFPEVKEKTKVYLKKLDNDIEVVNGIGGELKEFYKMTPYGFNWTGGN